MPKPEIGYTASVIGVDSWALLEPYLTVPEDVPPSLWAFHEHDIEVALDRLAKNLTNETPQNELEEELMVVSKSLFDCIGTLKGYVLHVTLTPHILLVLTKEKIECRAHY